MESFPTDTDTDVYVSEWWKKTLFAKHCLTKIIFQQRIVEENIWLWLAWSTGWLLYSGKIYSEKTFCKLMKTKHKIWDLHCKISEEKYVLKQLSSSQENFIQRKLLTNWENKTFKHKIWIPLCWAIRQKQGSFTCDILKSCRKWQEKLRKQF